MFLLLHKESIAYSEIQYFEFAEIKKNIAIYVTYPS